MLGSSAIVVAFFRARAMKAVLPAVIQKRSGIAEKRGRTRQADATSSHGAVPSSDPA